MSKEDQIFDLLEKFYIEFQDTKKELKEEIIDVRQEILNVRTELRQEISNVRTELRQEISNVRTELKDDISGIREDIKTLNDNQRIIFDKLEKMGSDIESIKEEFHDVQMITASNYKDIVKLKSIR